MGRWYAPPSGGYSAKSLDGKAIRSGKPPKIPATPEGVRAAQTAKSITDSKLGRNTMKQVNETIEVEWDQGLSIQEHEGFTRFEAGEDISIDVADNEDGGVMVQVYLDVTHGEDDLEVIGYLNIDDAEDARTLANAILAPFV